MDNKKIGKLIADLRKAKGLTQQDLGDIVGVGFRAASKWERGITMPDISIINELSKILGITSDELLSGEVNKDIKSSKNNKLSNKIKITISIITVIILIITATTIYLQNKTYIYEITQIDGADYNIEGRVTFNKNKMSILVNKLIFLEKNFSSQIIQDYEYEIYSKDTYIFGYGKNPEAINNLQKITIEEMSKNFKVNYNGETTIKRREIVENKLSIILYLRNENNSTITKKIEFILYK